MKDIEFSQFIEGLIFLGGLIAIWVRLQTKLKELDIRVSAIEKREDIILEKLDKLIDDITEIKIALNNKKNRDEE